MRLSLYRTLWGVIKAGDGPYTMAEALPKIKELGYDGIECGTIFAMNEGRENFKAMLAHNDLKWIGMTFSGGPDFIIPGAYEQYPEHPKQGRGVVQHLDVWKAQVEEALEMGASKVNSHSGYDYFTRSEAEQFFYQAQEFEKNIEVPILHETHRKRVLGFPWVAREILPSFPTLKLTADLSHWVCTAETNCDDPELNACIQQFASQVHHIHARIGYDHGPQVPDPRAPMWEPYNVGFSRWFEMIWKAQLARGETESTFEPEHGPPSYQVCDPNTGVPLADVWDVNTWVGERGKQDFAKFMAKQG